MESILSTVSSMFSWFACSICASAGRLHSPNMSCSLSSACSKVSAGCAIVQRVWAPLLHMQRGQGRCVRLSSASVGS
jgi:hypothetical protein